MFGMPATIHSDNGIQLKSERLKQFLTACGVSTTNTSPYNPAGNGQCERVNGVIWKSLQLCLKTLKLTEEKVELALSKALHSIRSTLCTATNYTYHERMFSYMRRSPIRVTIPEWLQTDCPVLLRRRNRQQKTDPLVDEVPSLR